MFFLLQIFPPFLACSFLFYLFLIFFFVKKLFIYRLLRYLFFFKNPFPFILFLHGSMSYRSHRLGRDTGLGIFKLFVYLDKLVGCCSFLPFFQ